MNRIIVLDIKDFPEMNLLDMDKAFRKYIEDIWNAKVHFLGNYPDRDALKGCSIIKK